MAVTDQQKLDFLLKKIGYTKSKTGNVSGTGDPGNGSPKQPFAEAIPSPLVVANSSLWNEADSIPATPPGSDTNQVKVYSTTSAIRMTEDVTSSGSRSWIAYSTYNNLSSTRLTNWIDTQFGAGYLIKVFKNDPTVPANALSAGATNENWFFDYSAGVLNFNDTNVPTHNDIYIVGYRYIGQTGAPTSGISTFSYFDLTVERNLDVGVQGGISTFRNNIDLNADLDVDGHTNLDNVSISGVSTFSEDVIIGVGATVGIGSTVFFRDGVQAIFGDNEDLQIYHDNINGHSYIKDSGTGRLVLQSDNEIEMITFNPPLGGGSEKMFVATKNAGTKLYYDGIERLTTASSGVNIVGTTTTGQLAVTGVSTFSGNIDINADIDVDGHTNLDNVSISGITTTDGQIKSTYDHASQPRIHLTGISANNGYNYLLQGNNDAGSRAVHFVNGSQRTADNGQNTYTIRNDGGKFHLGKHSYISVLQGSTTYLQHGTSTKLQTSSTGINVTGNVVSDGLVVDGNSDLNGDLDVDGHTNLDNISVAGVSTFTGDATFSGSVSIGGTLTYEDVTNVDSVGLLTARSGIRVTGGVIEALAGENKIPSLYANMAALPNAGSYHGMFAHVHSTGRGYFAHGGAWYELVNADLSGRVGTGTESYFIDRLVSTSTTATSLNVVGVSTFGGAIDANSTSNFGDDVTFQTANTNNLVLDKSDNSLKFGDSVKAKFGTGSDLEIYHDTAASIIENKNLALNLYSKTDIQLRSEKGAGMQIYAIFRENGNNEFYYNNSKKLETTNIGIKATGQVEATTNMFINGTNGSLFFGSGTTYHNNAGIGIASNDNYHVVGSLAGDLVLGAKVGENIVFGTNSSGFATKRLKIASDGNVSVTNDFDVDGHTNLDNVSVAGVSTFSDNVRIVDNKSLLIGDLSNGDLSLVHDGNNSVIRNRTGDLYLANATQTGITISGSTGDVRLYYANNLKLETESTGIKVTGKLRTTGDLDVDGHTNLDNVSVSGITTFSGIVDAVNTPASIRVAQDIQHKGDADTKISFPSADTITFDTAGTTRLNIASNGNISVTNDIDVDGHTNLDNVNIVGVTTTTGDINIDADNKKLQIGNDQDLQLVHTGTYSNIYNQTGDLDISSDVIRLKNANRTETFAAFINNGQAELYYDNSRKFYTTTTGITVTGTAVATGADINGDLDVDGHTNLDNVSIVGVTTITGTLLDLNSNSANPAIVKLRTNVNTSEIEGRVSGGENHLVLSSNNSTDHLKITGNTVQLPNDDQRLEIGANQELKIAQDGTHNVTYMQNVGPLQLQTDDLRLYNYATSDLYLRAQTNAGVQLYYDYSTYTTAKLATTATGINVTGLTDTDTFLSSGNATFSGTITAGGATGTNGQYLKSTGSGVAWASFPTLRSSQTFTASAGQTTFSFSYTVGLVDVFVNGIKLSTSEFTATNGSSVVLAVGCFVGDIVELNGYNTVSGGGGGGGGLGNVVEDTTPQLGGNLDLFNKTITGTGNINMTGVVTATTFVGDGSGLTGIVASGSGVVVKNSGSTVGTAGTINFGDNLSVTPISAGIVTITGSAGVDTSQFNVNKLNVSGISTFNGNIDVNADVVIDGDIDVDGHTNLDNVNIAGVTTIGSYLKLRSFATGGSPQFTAAEFRVLKIDGSTGGPMIQLMQNGADREEIQFFTTLFAAEFQKDGRLLLNKNFQVTGVSTFTGAIDANGDLDVDGHTNLDNVSIAGVATVTGNIIASGAVDAAGMTIAASVPSLNFNDTNNDPDFRLLVNSNSFIIEDTTNSQDRFTIGSTGNISIAKDLDVDGHTNLDNVNIAGVVTATTFKGALEATSASFSSNIDANGDLDVDGHTNLDNVNIAGVTSCANSIHLNQAVPEIRFNSTTHENDFRIINYQGNLVFQDTDATANRFEIASNGTVNFLNNVNANGGLQVTQNATFNNDIDVDGHTNLDNVSVAGVTTFASNVSVGSSIAVGTGVTVESNGQATYTGIVTALKFVGDGSGLTNLPGGGSYGNNDVDNHLNVSGASSGQILSWNGSDYAWVADQTGGGGSGISTISGVVNIANDLDVDGHTNLDNVSISGLTTSVGNITISNTHPRLIFNDTTNNPDYLIDVNAGHFLIYDSTNSANRFLINADGHIDLLGDVDITNDLDVDGHTNLDNVSIAGVTTISHAGSTSALIIDKGNASSNAIDINTTATTNACRIKFNESGSNKAQIAYSHDNDRLELVAQSGNGIAFYSGGNLTTRINTDGHLYPNTDSTYDLGLNGTRWRNLYADTLYGDGSNLTGVNANVGITTNLSGSFTASAGSAATINTFGYGSGDIVVEYTVFIKNGSDFQSQKLLAMRDGTTIHSTQFAVMYSSSLLVQLDATISSGNILLRATPETGVSGSTTYKVKREVM